MININLVPGSAKRSKKRGSKLSLGRFLKKGGGGGGGGSRGGSGSMPKLDSSMTLMGGGWAIGLALLGWMFLGGRHNVSTLSAQIEAAQLDSVRLESAIKSQQDLENRRNVVAQKVTIVQEIDANRYVWAHIHDEVARAVPEYTWLTQIAFMATDSGSKYPHFQVQGRTGNNFALTKYLQQLEQSPFIRKVVLKESQLVREDNKLVYSFLLEADYEPPPADLLETVPLFANEQPDSAAAEPAPNAGRQSAPNAAQPNRTAPQPNATAKPGGPAQVKPAPAPAKKEPR